MPWRKIVCWLGLGFGLRLVLGLGTISLGDNCTRTIIWAVPITSLTGYNIIWYACDERKFFFPFRFESCASGGCSSQLGTFHFLLIRTEWSWLFYHFHFLGIFQKICKCIKMLFQKIKPIISSSFLYIKKIIIKKLSKSILQNILFK